MSQEHTYSGPVASILAQTDGPLAPGQLGLIVAPAGVGKSSLLIHMALNALVDGGVVLHVTAQERIEEVRVKYEQAFRAATGTDAVGGSSEVYLRTERNRMIHSYRERAFSVEHFRNNLEMLSQVAQFRPTLIVMDGIAENELADSFEALHTLALDREVIIWLTLRCEPDSDELSKTVWDHTALALRMKPKGTATELVQYFFGGPNKSFGLYIDPSTGLLVDPNGSPVELQHEAVRATECTLYSGGAHGSELVFGEVAASYGLQEVNFTFEGHKQERIQGRYLLSAAELGAGNVSLVYVSNRLNRTYSEGSLIRKVLQTLWHMVSRSQQVFVIGEIQDDGTVVGGTGWSVELGRMWDKDLWVYDQAKLGWFRWNQQCWEAGTPLITSLHHCGTGTRYLTEEGRAAINDLYHRSFKA